MRARRNGVTNFDRFVAIRANQNSFSVVSAANALLFFLTACMHLVWGSPALGDQLIAGGLASLAFVFLVVPLTMGHRYPRRLGLFGACLGLGGIYLTVIAASSPQMVLNAILMVPLIALTFGWFFYTEYARPLMLVAIGLLLVLLAIRSQSVDWPVMSATTAIYVALITGFLFEAGGYLHQQTARRASQDPLTGVLNRYGFWREAALELHRAARAGTALTLVAIDFDDFKTLNDTRGHLAGDFALRQTIAEWQTGIRPYDLIVRLGGDEFALLLTGNDFDSAHQVVSRLRSSSQTSWSWGIAQWQPGESLESLLERADAELLSSRTSR